AVAAAPSGRAALLAAPRALATGGGGGNVRRLPGAALLASTVACAAHDGAGSPSLSLLSSPLAVHGVAVCGHGPRRLARRTIAGRRARAVHTYQQVAGGNAWRAAAGWRQRPRAALQSVFR